MAESMKKNYEIQYPTILKLEHGSSAVGVQLVYNKADLEQQYDLIQNSLQSDDDFSGIGLGHDSSMLVVDYLVGSEHDVDVVICGRKLVAAFISDNGPTRVPIFTETAAMMPTALPVDKQAQLVTAAYQCCTEIGLSDGLFNVEFKMTATGPKLIEINARMGGFYLRHWIQHLYGVDIMLYSFMAAAGVKPFLPKLPPTKCLMGIMLLPSLHKHVLEDKTIRSTIMDLQEKEKVIWVQFSESPDEATDGENFEEPFANLAVVGENKNDAREKLLKFCIEFRIHCEGYDVRHFCKDFS